MNIVRQLRVRAGVTQHELADRAGTSQSTVAAYETGTKSPTLRTLQRFAHVLGLEIVVDFVPALTREDARSLAYHQAVITRLRRGDLDAIPAAKSNLARFRNQHPHARSLWSRWEIALDLPREELIEILQSRSETAREMRQVSPFAGLLSARDRADVLRRFRGASDN